MAGSHHCNGIGGDVALTTGKYTPTAPVTKKWFDQWHIHPSRLLKMNFVLSNEGWFSADNYIESNWETEKSVYEVLRIIKGVPLFVEDHFARLVTSSEIQGIRPGLTLDDFVMQLKLLIGKNHQPEGNIKFVCLERDGQFNWAFRFIRHSYPTSEEYLNGVATDWLDAERRNPNAKVFQNSVRSQADEMMAARSLYEVLLVDRNGLITEGSRSNVFFVKAGVFYTAPKAMVLVGITRQKVIDCIKSLRFEVIEDAVAKAEIHNFDAAIITGTSPKVLPINSIGDWKPNVKNEAVLKLMTRYDQLISDYIATNQA